VSHQAGCVVVVNLVHELGPVARHGPRGGGVNEGTSQVNQNQGKDRVIRQHSVVHTDL